MLVISPSLYIYLNIIRHSSSGTKVIKPKKQRILKHRQQKITRQLVQLNFLLKHSIIII